jgi:hypothetical protein
MNSSRLLYEIDVLGRFLEMAYLPHTAAAVRSLSASDFSTNPQAGWHTNIVEEYRREVEHSRNILGEHDAAYHVTLIDALDLLITDALPRSKEFMHFLLAARPLVEAIGESHGNTRELYRSFVSGRSSTKQVYLNLSLMYLILCEGIFKNQARLLLGLRAVGDGKNIATDFLSARFSPKVLLEQLEEHQLEAFAAGYHRHVRNAIAHGNMQFQRGTDAMRFKDFDPSNPTSPLFDETWPFVRLAALYAKLDDTYLVLSTYLQIHFLPLAVG